MSRNFEEAYRAEVQLNIPDLWDRIESALPEKKTGEFYGEPEEAQAVAKENATYVANVKPTNLNHKSNTKKKSKYAWMKWASLAAAAMLVLLLMPALIGVGIIGLAGGAGSKMESAADSTVSMEMMETQTNESEAYPDMEAAESLPMEDAVYENAWLEGGAEFEGDVENDHMTQNSMGNAEETENVITAETELSQDNPYVEDYRKLLAGGMSVRVMGKRLSSDNETYCLLQLEVPEEAYETFEGREEFRGGQLEVRFYYADGDVPATGESYSANVYEAGIEKYLRAEINRSLE